MKWDGEVIRPAGYLTPPDDVPYDVRVAELIYRSVDPEHRAAMWRTFLTISDLPEAA